MHVFTKTNLVVCQISIQPTVGVHIPSTQSDDAGRKKRISDSSEFQQLRMFIHYDDSVNTQ